MSLRALSALLIAILIGPNAPIADAQETERLRLPNAEDTIRDRLQAESLLRGGKGPERTLPGRVDDRERVLVKVTSDGIANDVVVEQRLQLHGIGDYFVKIPGPVVSATALADSTAQPGVRSGSLVWQGFATKGETLGASVVLDPEQEQDRLPAGMQVTATLNGKRVELDEKLTGDLELDITITNESPVDIELPRAPVDGAETAGVLDRVHDLLTSREKPEPGRDGVPVYLPTRGPLENSRESVAAPLAARLVVELDGKVRDVVSLGAEIGRRASLVSVERRSLLSGNARSATVRIAARVEGTRPDIRMILSPSLPAPAEAEPPGPGTWMDAARSGAVSDPGILRRLVLVLAEVARLPDVDAYLGNPDRDGAARTTYSFEMVATPDRGTTPPAALPAPEDRSLLGIVVACLMVIAAGLGAIVWWALS